MKKLALLKEIEQQLIRIAAIDYQEYMKAHPKSKKKPSDPLFRSKKRKTKKSPSKKSPAAPSLNQSPSGTPVQRDQMSRSPDQSPSTTPPSKPSQPSKVKKTKKKKRSPSHVKSISKAIEELDSSHSMRYKSYNIDPRKKLITYRPYEGGFEGEIEDFFKEKGDKLNLKGWKVKLETSHWGDGAKSKTFSIRPKSVSVKPESKTPQKTKMEDFSDEELDLLGLDRNSKLESALEEHKAKQEWENLKKQPEFRKFNPYYYGSGHSEDDYYYSDRVKDYNRRKRRWEGDID